MRVGVGVLGVYLCVHVHACIYMYSWIGVCLHACAHLHMYTTLSQPLRRSKGSFQQIGSGGQHHAHAASNRSATRLVLCAHVHVSYLHSQTYVDVSVCVSVFSLLRCASTFPYAYFHDT